MILDLANRWRKDWCKVHNCLNSNPPCNCEPPFQLFNFPTEPHLIKSSSSQPNLWTQGQNRGFVHLILWIGSQQQKTPHLNLSLGYPSFEKRVQAILGKKGKQELLLMVYLPPKTNPNRIKMKTFQELLLKKKIN